MSEASASAVRDWNPGLDNGAQRLVDVYEAMPRSPESAVPWYVHVLEHPASPLALSGAVDLCGHDCIHLLLGRGLMQQDEAFVLGFTMGASRSSSAFQARLFRHCARWLYRGEYRFSALDCEVFGFAEAAGQRAGCARLHAVDFARLRERTLSELRCALGIEVDALCELYGSERRRFPCSPASRRLPGARSSRHAAPTERDRLATSDESLRQNPRMVSV